MYTISASGAQLDTRERVTYDRLHDATAKADRLAQTLGGEFEVTHQETGVVAYVTSQRAILKRDEGIHFVPWTRLETPKFSAPDIEGFYPAYTRKRIEAVVYRAYDNDAELPWLVWDGRTNGRRLVPNTKAACELTRQMRQGLMLEA